MLVCTGLALVAVGALTASGTTSMFNLGITWLHSLVGALLSLPFFIIGIPLLIAGTIGLGIWGAKLAKFRRFYATIPDVRATSPFPFLPSSLYVIRIGETDLTRASLRLGVPLFPLRRTNWKCGRLHSAPPPPLRLLLQPRPLPPFSCNRCPSRMSTLSHHSRSSHNTHPRVCIPTLLPMAAPAAATALALDSSLRM